jgi:hypothetical protein
MNVQYDPSLEVYTHTCLGRESNSYYLELQSSALPLCYQGYTYLFYTYCF